MGNGGFDNDGTSFGFDQPNRDASRLSMLFNPEILAQIQAQQKLDPSNKQDSINHNIMAQDKNNSFYLPFRYPSKSGLTPLKKQ